MDLLPASLALEGLSLEARRDFRCFNTDVAIQLTDWRWSHLLAQVEAFFHRFESRFSRFLPDSELTRFNRRQTPSVAVSDDMLDLLEECLCRYDATGGVFNPLVLENLEAAGYDASFEQLAATTKSLTAQTPPPRLTCLKLDAARGTASLPLGLRLDFGGIGKGYAVDFAASLLDEAGSYLVDAGGDIYAAGRAPDGGYWTIDVANPALPGTRLDVVALSNQAIATSWTTLRRWKRHGAWAHHLIDTRTGLPAESGVVGSTVIASRAVDADVFAKCALILGPNHGVAFLEARGAPGLLVLEDGSIRTTNAWPSAEPNTEV
jgi:thiamine biosynthesis lipoprotein